MQNDLKKIKTLVGEISKEQLNHTDCFITDHVQLFMPMTGPCQYAVREHAHPCFSFVYTFDNHSKIKIDNTIINPSQGKLVVMSPRLVHTEILSEDQFSRYIAIFINSDFFMREFHYYGDHQPALYRGDVFIPSPELLPGLKEFMAEYEVNAPGAEQMLAVLGIKIIHQIIRSITGEFHHVPRKIKHRLEVDQAITWMHENYAEKITVQNIASHVAMSPSHFSRIFKQETSTSPMDHLMDIRLAMAKILLLAGELNMTEIALSTGFKASSHFSFSFQKKYKITPSDFRSCVTQQGSSGNQG